MAWVDTDAGGRIHFTAAFRWAEAAETALCRSLGILEDWSNYPRRAVEAEYLAVLRFEDEIEVELAPERVGTTSVDREGSGTHCTRGLLQLPTRPRDRLPTGRPCAATTRGG